MKRFSLLAIIAILVTSPVAAFAHTVAQPAENQDMTVSSSESQTIPTFVITDVVRDQTVTIQTDNFAAGDIFEVHMNFYGTQGVGGTIVDTLATGAGGRLTATFSIPAVFHGLDRIAIRLESPTTGYYAYNWFYNNTTGGSSGGGGIPSGYSGYPTFAISKVTQNQAVQIAPMNFIPNDTYNVRMNWYGTAGSGGAVVDTVTAAADGSLPDTTFAIPGFLSGQYKIAIQLESPTTGYFAYNWFYNNTTSPPAPAP